MLIDGLKFTEMSDSHQNGIVSFQRKKFENLKNIIDTFTEDVLHDISFDEGVTTNKAFVKPYSFYKNEADYIISFNVIYASEKDTNNEYYIDIRSFIVDQLQTTDPETVLKYTKHLEYWKNGIAYKKGYRLKYKGVAYEVVDDVLSSVDKTPDKAPALYKKITKENSPEYPKYVKGKTYQIGDKVIHNGNIWECTWSDNSREPGGLGWKKI